MADVTTCLTDFLARVEPLPAEIRRSLKMVQDLDQESVERLMHLKELQRTYIKRTHERMSRSRGGGKVMEDVAALSEIQRVRDDATQKADMKIRITTDAYDLVDQHIRRLDGDLKRYETHLRASGLWRDPEPATPATKKTVKRSKGRKSASAATPVEQSLVQMVDDAPIDPNEPIYCVCRRVAFGGMVGCDNDDCLVEWFHYGCVGLTEQPTGKWYCPECREKMVAPKKKRQRRR